MASSPAKSLLILLASTAVLLPAAVVEAASELLLDSESMTIDRDTNLIHLRGPRITQGEMVIQADEAFAKSIDFDKADDWRFSGNVRIQVDATELRASSATFKFAANQLASAELLGSPASVTDHSTTRQEPVHGNAAKIYYDYRARTLRLLDDVWLYKGRNEIHGCDLIYDFGTERLTSGSSDCGVRFRVLPPTDKNSQAKPAGSP
jgi:lipopolysaccharide transport protein LptA